MNKGRWGNLMAMDWLTALATQDQSFEAQLAKRDLGKKIALLQDIAQQAEQRRQFGQRQGLDERQLTAHIEATKAQREDTKATQDELKRARAIDDERQQVNQYLAAPPGTVFRDPNAVRAMRKAGVGDRLAPETTGPQPEGATPSYILDRQEAETKFENAQRAERHQQELEKDARARLGLAQQASDRAAREETQRNKERDTRIKANEARTKALNEKADQMLPGYKEAATAEVNRVLKQMEIDPSALEQLRGLTTEQIEEQRLAKAAKIMQDYYNESEKEKVRRKGGTPLPQTSETTEQRINRLAEEARKRLGGG